MINEIAPRPHNSGHYTIEACPVSQYEAHLRAILDLPLPDTCTELTTPAIMLNILGSSTPDEYLQTCKRALEISGAHVHLYGKEEARKGRKMGHITFTASSMASCEALLAKCIGEEGVSSESLPEVAVIMGSDSDLPVMAVGCQILEDFGVKPHVTIVSAHRTPERMVEFAKTAASRGVKVIIAGAGGIAPTLFDPHTNGIRRCSSPWNGSCNDIASSHWSSRESDPSRWHGFSLVDCTNACVSPAI